MIKPTKGLAVDGACSGNPGPGEYRGVDIETGEELFRIKFNFVTNNLMEFFAIVHALKYNKENGKKYAYIYSDSITAISWVKTGCQNTTLEKSDRTKNIHEFIATCNHWLANNTKSDNLPLEKWDTTNWGEIPADFGNKIKVNKNLPVKKEEYILKSDLKKFIEELYTDPLPDITTLSRLAGKFKITIDFKN